MECICFTELLGAGVIGAWFGIILASIVFALWDRVIGARQRLRRAARLGDHRAIRRLWVDWGESPPEVVPWVKRVQEP